ncbi:hypothetical protein SAMN05428952_105015 [Nitrosomonas sp. Nm132]|nr:hypothetical protein SAMN05428952_105015 [Nitrosomonas sp. Nm132]
MSGDNNGLDYLCLDGRAERLQRTASFCVFNLFVEIQLKLATNIPIINV